MSFRELLAELWCNCGKRLFIVLHPVSLCDQTFSIACWWRQHLGMWSVGTAAMGWQLMILAVFFNLCDSMYGLFCSLLSEPCQIEVRLLLAYNSNRSKAAAKIAKSTWNESPEALPQPESGIEGTIPFSKPVKVYIMPKPARRWSLTLQETPLWDCWIKLKTIFCVPRYWNQTSAIKVKLMNWAPVLHSRWTDRGVIQIIQDGFKKRLGFFPILNQQRQFSVSIPAITALGQSLFPASGFSAEAIYYVNVEAHKSMLL